MKNTLEKHFDKRVIAKMQPQEKHYNSRAVTLLFRVKILILSRAFQKKTVIGSSVGRGKTK